PHEEQSKTTPAVNAPIHAERDPWRNAELEAPRSMDHTQPAGLDQALPRRSPTCDMPPDRWGIVLLADSRWGFNTLTSVRLTRSHRGHDLMARSRFGIRRSATAPRT